MRLLLTTINLSENHVSIRAFPQAPWSRDASGAVLVSSEYQRERFSRRYPHGRPEYRLCRGLVCYDSANHRWLRPLGTRRVVAARFHQTPCARPPCTEKIRPQDARTGSHKDRIRPLGSCYRASPYQVMGDPPQSHQNEGQTLDLLTPLRATTRPPAAGLT